MALGVSKKAEIKELEKKYLEANDLLKKKQHELDNKEKQIHFLTKNINKWSRKYHELEVSISDNILDAQPAMEDDECDVKQLQIMLIKLNARNAKLQKRLLKMQAMLNKKKNKTPKDHSNSSQPSTKEAPTTGKDTDPEFSKEMQAILKKHAKPV